MSKHKEQIFAFIDAQNLYTGVKSSGWSLDYKKFRLYLSNKYGVTKAYIFMGYVPGNEALYASLQKQGYIIVLKPTVEYKENNVTKRKGNVDADLVLYSAAILYDEYDKAVLITNDGDFLCLFQFLEERKKLSLLLTPNNKYSSLYKDFTDRISTIEKSKESLRK
jgi:uncharacterized LabA/DUF88 family protein